MATSMSLEPYDGYPTKTAMRVNVSFSVTYAASYVTYFELYDADDNLIDDAWGSTYSMSANSSKSGIYKTFSGLDPGTDYYIVGSLWNADTDTRLDIDEPIVEFTTDSPAKLRVYFWDGDLSESSGVVYEEVDVIGPLQSDTDEWTFAGWATEASSTIVEYQEGDVIPYDEESNARYDLYAVYQQTSTIYCYYITASTGVMNSNTRTKIQYRCNTDKSTSSTDFYNTITLPNFSTSNQTITTSTPARDWTAIGWRRDTTAEDFTYEPGQDVSTDRITGNLYAVYSNTCSITYNANGGSGTMPTVSDTAYYNASGEYTTPTFAISDCIFTPPSKKQFDHWNVKADGTGTKYTGSTISTNYNIILYAIWVIGRPDDWYWVSTVAKGAAMAYTQSGTTIIVKPLTAAEWLDFVDRIEEFSDYCGVSVDSTYLYRATNGVASGSNMTTTQANGARYLINALDPPTTVPAAVTVGQAITAAFINGLKDSLNSIP